MNSVVAKFLRADKILEAFAKNNDKFVNRYAAILSEMETFIKASDIEGKVKVNELTLGYALLDYFEDIRRLKEFHKLEHINNIKIVAYMSYWILNRKPIQVIEMDKKLVYVNERFVLAYILNFLGDTEDHILERSNLGLKSFSETFFYFLKYRLVSANSLEMVLMAFFAGRIYQEKDEDISDKLAKYEIEETSQKED